MGVSPLPAIATQALLSSIRSHPQLPSHTWYFIAATTLSVLNRPDEVPKVYEHVLHHGFDPQGTKPGRDERLHILRRMREALIKSSPIGGIPKVLDARLPITGRGAHQPLTNAARPSIRLLP